MFFLFDVTSPAHYKLAQSIAEQSAVLIVNRQHALPLAPTATRRFAGIGSDSGVHGVGSGSAGQGNQHSQHGDRVISLAEGISKRLAEDAGGSTVSNRTVSWQQEADSCVGMACVMPVTQNDIDEAVALASDADVADVEVGLVSGEGVDRRDLSLGNGGADMQSKLVAAVAAANNFTVVVLRASGAVAPMTFLELPSVRAVILQFLPGSQAGHALAAILFGDRNPSGKLPLSFPRGVGQTWVKNYPCDDRSSNCSMCGRTGCHPGHCVGATCASPCTCDITFEEGLNIGYRWFDSANESPLFEFGFGCKFRKVLFFWCPASFPCT